VSTEEPKPTPAQFFSTLKDMQAFFERRRAAHPEADAGASLKDAWFCADYYSDFFDILCRDMAKAVGLPETSSPAEILTGIAALTARVAELEARHVPGALLAQVRPMRDGWVADGNLRSFRTSGACSVYLKSDGLWAWRVDIGVPSVMHTRERYPTEASAQLASEQRFAEWVESQERRDRQDDLESAGVHSRTIGPQPGVVT
jgi:hypothetical protein